VVKLVADRLAQEFFDDMDSLSEIGWSRSEIAQLFRTPTRLWRLSHHLLQGMRAASASTLQQQDRILQVLGLVGELKHGSPFLADGANLILGPAEAESLAGTVLDRADSAIQGSHRAAAVLWSYAEALYFVAHELGVELHGPYRLPGGMTLLVRDFFSLGPQELWPEVTDLLGFGSVRVAVVYSGFPGHMDVYNNVYVDNGVRLASRAVAAAAWIDDSAVPLADLEHICDGGIRVISHVTSMVDGWSLVDIARRYVDLFWWRKRELSVAARGSWRPGSDVIARIVEGAIPPASAANPSEAELRRQFDLTGN
jgi:hypothetical protein